MAWFALTVPTTAYETKIRFRAVSSVERDQSFDCNKAALQHEQSSNEAIGKPTSSSEKTTTNDGLLIYFFNPFLNPQYSLTNFIGDGDYCYFLL